MFERKSSLAVAIAAQLAFSAALPTPALAYMGIGAGLGAIGTALSFLGVFLLMIVGFVWYPLKRLLRGSRAPAAADVESHEEA